MASRPSIERGSRSILMRKTLTLALAALYGAAAATTWGKATVKDPIAGGDCAVSKPLSAGSYIYDWPSKHDGVFWPHTDPAWIWFCPGSGYIAFGDDFDRLAPKDVARIRAHLAKHYTPQSGEPSLEQKLVWLEAVYRLRGMDALFWGWFARVKAVHLDALALESRRDAMRLLEKEVATLPPGFDLIQKLYVLGDYHR